MKYYIAYGSNLNVYQMCFRCPDARQTAVGFLPNYRLVYRGSRTGSYLTIEPAAGHYVPVGIWQVSDADEARLDKYEGYPNFYRKIDLQVSGFDIEFGSGICYNAFAYVMVDGAPAGLPTPRYVNTCKQGYDDFGFPMQVLDEAFQYSKELMLLDSRIAEVSTVRKASER